MWYDERAINAKAKDRKMIIRKKKIVISSM